MTPHPSGPAVVARCHLGFAGFVQGEMDELGVSVLDGHHDPHLGVVVPLHDDRSRNLFSGRTCDDDRHNPGCDGWLGRRQRRGDRP